MLALPETKRPRFAVYNEMAVAVTAKWSAMRLWMSNGSKTLLPIPILSACKIRWRQYAVMPFYR